MNNKVLISIIIGVCIVVGASIIAFGMMNTTHEKVVVVNNTTHNNTTGVNTTGLNTTVEKISNDNNNQESQDTATSNSQSSSEEVVWHNGGYTEKGKVDIIKKYGMGPESEQAMREAGY